MTKEQIERYADDYSAGIVPAYSVGDFARYQIADAFEAGAQWRISSVWHDVSEHPKFPGKVECVKFLLLRKNGECDRYLIGKYNWDDIINMEKPIKWAYIDDFLPERKEESK